jgi:sensor c-di-GMP phosphodiesterase-like protein
LLLQTGRAELRVQDELVEWPASTAPLLSPDVFVSAKLATKASRQLQDVLTVATQQMPQWLTELVESW